MKRERSDTPRLAVVAIAVDVAGVNASNPVPVGVEVAWVISALCVPMIVVMPTRPIHEFEKVLQCQLVGRVACPGHTREERGQEQQPPHQRGQAAGQRADAVRAPF